MRLGQTSLIYFVSKFLGSALGFLATIYFARVLGETVLGYYALVLAIVTWLGLGGEVGLTKALTKRISEGSETEEYVGAGIAITTLMMSVISVGVFVFRDAINAYVGVPVAEFVVLLLFAMLYKSLINATLQGSHLVHVYAVLSTVKLGSRSGIQILLVFAGFGLSGMLVGYAAGAIITGIIGLWYLSIRPAAPSREHIVSLVDYAKFSWLGDMRSKSFDTVDIAVLGVFVSAGLVGIYSVAWSIAKFLDIFGSAIRSTLFPEMSKLASDEDPRAVAGLTEDALMYAGLLLIPGLVGGLAIGDRLMLLYGEGFVEGESVLVLLIAALLVYTYKKQLLNTLNAIDRPDLSFRANGVFIVSNVILNLVLVYTYSWVGAAVATTLSAAIGLLVAFSYTRNHVPFTVPYSEILRQWIAALVMGTIIYVARQAGETHWIAASNELFVVSLVLFGAGTYFLTLLLVSNTFRTTVTNNVPFDVPFLYR